MCVLKGRGVLIVSEWSKIAQITVMNLSVIIHSFIEFVYFYFIFKLILV